MLYIGYDSEEGIKEITWHTGFPIISLRVDLQAIKYVQADGDELAKILELFKIKSSEFYSVYTIPVSFRPVQYWAGDIAKSIVYALR